MKILCCCNAGRVRSVAIKKRYEDLGHECLSVGVGFVSKSTLCMLVAWADLVVVADMEFWNALEDLCSVTGKTLKNLGLGEDRWDNPNHPELRRVVEEEIPA